jgi:hypothetical protein
MLHRTGKISFAHSGRCSLHQKRRTRASVGSARRCGCSHSPREITCLSKTLIHNGPLTVTPGIGMSPGAQSAATIRRHFTRGRGEPQLTLTCMCRLFREHITGMPSIQMQWMSPEPLHTESSHGSAFFGSMYRTSRIKSNSRCG